MECSENASWAITPTTNLPQSKPIHRFTGVSCIFWHASLFSFKIVGYVNILNEYK